MPNPGDYCDVCETHRDKNNHCDCFRPDWENECEVCGQTPIVPTTGMCGPCTFGDASTIRGNW